VGNGGTGHTQLNSLFIRISKPLSSMIAPYNSMEACNFTV